MQIFFAIFLLAVAIANAQAAFPDLGKAQAAVQNIFSILDRVPLIDSEKPGMCFIPRCGHIQPANVRYTLLHCRGMAWHGREGAAGLARRD